MKQKPKSQSKHTINNKRAEISTSKKNLNVKIYGIYFFFENPTPDECNPMWFVIVRVYVICAI